ncbi:probable arginine--tRNA ligase, mitochondrial [Cylas formicarius]|uniref:probable arginine--tRNA ligase, mitochondrial n=1 Tax=Cylas formicarius TaxID=197179 RepID=UPI002958C731|nr:probable arginine--tRNA ligase, mitochondrial [Cylas formicarius]
MTTPGMSSKLKLYLGRKIIDSLNRDAKLSPVEFLPLFRVGSPPEPAKIELNVSLDVLEAQLGVPDVNEILKIRPDDIIRSVRLVRDRANRKVSFEIDRRVFMRDVMENCFHPALNVKPKKVVVEFSSPNVAKPFHYGHLRSTIIGNFLSNLNAFAKNKVTRLNYLGDWGTQFGLIKVGMDELGYGADAIREDPIKILYKCYVHANLLAEKDGEVMERAKREFSKLERGSEEEVAGWRRLLDYTKSELDGTYARLGVSFDEYHSESMYGAKNIAELLETLRQKRVITKQADGKEVTELGNQRSATVVKSDGSSLYLTRDIAAAIDRYRRYDFDRMYYVVENGQSDHFHALKSVIHKMDLPWADRLIHVKFGRVRGMSTRKGTAVFLKDILDECRELVVQRQIESPTTKVPVTDERTSDVLGVSCVIVNDLKQRRQRDYEFSWDKVLQVQGDTGIRLQYNHCRLWGVARNAGVAAAKTCDPDVLAEPEVTELLTELARFQDALHVANEQLEACLLVNYLFQLCNRIGRALKALRVKGAEPEVASQRLLLFDTARKVLASGMEILGLIPLEKM